MLKTRLLHPQILMALGSSGHGAGVMISDGNFSFSTHAPEGATIVYLNLAPDMVRVTDVLSVLIDFIPIESARVMVPENEGPPPVHDEFKKLLGPETPFISLSRKEFYNQVQSKDTCLIIATGDRRRFANILITIGVQK